MDSVLLCSFACVSVGVMLRLVIAPGSYCGCVDVSFFFSFAVFQSISLSLYPSLFYGDFSTLFLPLGTD